MIGLYIYVTYLDSMKNRVNIDFLADLKECYGIDAKIVKKDVDKSENGKYILESKEKNPIEFIVIKEFGSYRFDYFNRTLKEEYEKSSDEIKKTFESHENHENSGLLNYSLIAEPTSLNDIDSIVNKFVQMRDNAGKHFGFDWNVNIRTDGVNQRILSMGETEDEESICRRAKCEYVVIEVELEKEEKFTEEEIERYYKPYDLNLFVNGEEVLSKLSKPVMQQNVIYDYYNEDYTMPISALEDIEGVQITYDKYSTPLELTFKDKTYKIGGATVNLEYNTIPTYIEVQNVKKILEAELEFDYKKQTLNIVMK